MTRLNTRPKSIDMSVRPKPAKNYNPYEKGLEYFFSSEVRGLVDDDGKPVKQPR